MIIGELTSVIYTPVGATKKPRRPHIHHFGDGGTKGRVKVKPFLVAGSDGHLYVAKNGSPYYIGQEGIVW